MKRSEWRRQKDECESTNESGPNDLDHRLFFLEDVGVFWRSGGEEAHGQRAVGFLWLGASDETGQGIASELGVRGSSFLVNPAEDEVGQTSDTQSKV